jgi:hypothetical protein
VLDPAARGLAAAPLGRGLRLADRSSAAQFLGRPPAGVHVMDTGVLAVDRLSSGS